MTPFNVPSGMVDTSSPEAQFASLLRHWITRYGQGYAQAAEYVAVCYARGYLQDWPATGAGGVMPEDLNAIIDLLNEFQTELDDPDKTLINKFRVDI
jgi:hypothetical protein